MSAAKPVKPAPAFVMTPEGVAARALVLAMAMDVGIGIAGFNMVLTAGEPAVIETSPSVAMFI